MVLTRGGGEGLHALDDDELIAAVASSPAPVAVALGHATDDLVVARVADAGFPTPTALGAWLRSALDDRLARRRQLQESELLLGSQSALDRLGRLQASAARWRLFGAASLAALVAFVLWHLFRPR